MATFRLWMICCLLANVANGFSAGPLFPSMTLKDLKQMNVEQLEELIVKEGLDEPGLMEMLQCKSDYVGYLVTKAVEQSAAAACADTDNLGDNGF